MKPLNTAVLLAGLFFLASVKPNAQTPPPAFIGCNNGGLMYMDPLTGSLALPAVHCVAPASLVPPAPVLTGGACAAPATGLTVYTQLPDKSCLPLVAIPSAGAIASNLVVEFGVLSPTDGTPVQRIQYYFTDNPPAQ